MLGGGREVVQVSFCGRVVKERSMINHYRSLSKLVEALRRCPQMQFSPSLFSFLTATRSR
jgi:hypothetical protein